MCFQILALRLLQAVLPSWDKAERSQDMKFLVEKLFSFLGSLLSTCSSDLPLLRGAGTDQTFSTKSCRFMVVCVKGLIVSAEGSMRRRKSRPQASLTATHSSTLAEEIVTVLRTLHSLSQWNGLINDYINTQLSSIEDIMTGCQSEAVRFTALSWLQLLCYKMLTQNNAFIQTLLMKLGIKTVSCKFLPFSVSWRSIFLTQRVPESAV